MALTIVDSKLWVGRTPALNVGKVILSGPVWSCTSLNCLNYLLKPASIQIKTHLYKMLKFSEFVTDSDSRNRFTAREVYLMFPQRHSGRFNHKQRNLTEAISISLSPISKGEKHRGTEGLRWKKKKAQMWNHWEVRQSAHEQSLYVQYWRGQTQTGEWGRVLYYR